MLSLSIKAGRRGEFPPFFFLISHEKELTLNNMSVPYLIICGSRKYDKDLSRIVDHFETIVRNNMLLPNKGYGKKDSTIQVLNIHTYSNYKKDNLSMYSDYSSEEHLNDFKEFVKTSSADFIHLTDNNTSLMRHILESHNIDIKLTKQLRCGLSYVAHAISNKVRPFLIGFSIREDQASSHQTNKIAINSHVHDAKEEVNIIKELHQRGLIDASFCTIIDESCIVLDFSDITPTMESINILFDLYPYDDVFVVNLNDEQRGYLSNSFILVDIVEDEKILLIKKV